MGRKSGSESIASVLIAFLNCRTWKQADLARQIGVERKQLVKILEDLHDGGLPLEREEDHPHVYWSVPKGWFPGAVAFRGKQLVELVLALQLAPQSPNRDRLLSQIASIASGVRLASSSAIVTRVLDPTEESMLAVLLQAADGCMAVRVRYYTLSRGEIAWRHLSVHRILIQEGRLVATCHRDGHFKWFRLDGMLSVQLAADEPFRNTSEDALSSWVSESVDGYHSGTKPVRCVFRVRHDDARWVKAQLPLPVQIEEDASETVFTALTSGLLPLARFLVGLGSSVRVDSPELRSLVLDLAQGAIDTARESLGDTEQKSGVPIEITN